MRLNSEPRRVVTQPCARGGQLLPVWYSHKWLAALLVAGLALSGVLSACGTAGTVAPTPAPTVQPTPTPGFTSDLYWPTTEWRTSTPEEQGIDSAQLLRALEHVDRDGINIRSMTVVRNGYIVLEAYYQPWKEDHQYHLYSVTKSVVGLLVGIAIEEGYIKDVNQPVLGFFPELTIKNRDSNKEEITIEDLLTMRSGLDCADEKLNFAMEASEDWVQFALDLPMVSPPGEKLVYCGAGVHLLSAIVGKATGMSASRYAQPRLFDPVGIAASEVTWWADPQGVSLGGYGLNLKPRDMAKLGLLLQRGGKWGDKQVIPEKWLATASAVHAPGDNEKSYGYTLWVYPTYFAAEGLGQQMIQVVNNRNMVVAITAAINEQVGPATRKLLEDYIIPAASADSPLPPNPGALQALKDKVKYLANPVEPVPPLPETATRISGKTYVMDENPSGWKSLTLTFAEGKPEAVAMLVDSTGENRVAIGLDNVYRTTEMPGGNSINVRGQWEDENTFVQRQVQPQPDLEEALIRLEFTGDELNIHGDEVIQDKYSVDMHGVAK